MYIRNLIILGVICIGSFLTAVEKDSMPTAEFPSSKGQFIQALSISADGKFSLISGVGKAMLFNNETGEKIRDLEAAKGQFVRALSISGDAKYSLISSIGKALLFYFSD